MHFNFKEKGSAFTLYIPGAYTCSYVHTYNMYVFACIRTFCSHEKSEFDMFLSEKKYQAYDNVLIFGNLNSGL